MSRKKAKVRAKVDQLEEKIEELEARWKRTLADYDNLSKRVEKEKSDWVKLASASLIDKLLSVLDDLERVEAHLKDRGLSLAMKQFRRILATEEVEEIKTLGEKFDPELMDCVEMVEGKKNIVIKIDQKGYKLAGKVIRPAKVKVGKGEKKDE